MLTFCGVSGGIVPEVVNWGMSKYVPFLHSEASHPLPLNPIGTIFA